MESAKPRTPAEESAEIARMWYVPPKPPIPAGWLVFSEDFILRALRGDVAHTQSQPTSPGWRIAVFFVQIAMGTGQAVIMLLSSIPILSLFMEMLAVYFTRGAIGSFVRSCFWKTKLKKLGQDTLIDRGVEIWGAANIEIGACCHLDTYVRLAAGEAGYGQKGSIVIGDYTHIGPRCHLAGRGGLTIRDFVALEAGVHVYSATNMMVHRHEPGMLVSLSHMVPDKHQSVFESPVIIDDYVIIGFNCLVLPGARLGKGVIVHPNSIVSKPYEAFANVVGPGRARQNGWRRPPKLDPRRLESQPAGT